MRKNLIILILLLALAGGIAFYLQHSVILMTPQNPVATTTVPGYTPEEIISTTTTMKVKVALLGAPMDTSDRNSLRGCDAVSLVEREVPYSSMPLNAALRELFSKKDVWMPGELAPGNFIASRTELYFDRADIQNGVAKIYLIGKIGPLGGACDDPRLRIQLEETALQFPTIQSVEYYLNNIKTDLTYSEKGI